MRNRCLTPNEQFVAISWLEQVEQFVTISWLEQVEQFVAISWLEQVAIKVYDILY